MAVNASDFKKMFPEFAEVPNARLQMFFDFAAENVNRNIFAEKSDRAEALLAAHFLTLADRGGAAGPITSEKVGDLSRSYGTIKSEQEELAATAYGSMFITMLKSLPITPRVVGCL